MNFRTFFLALSFLSFSSTEIIRNHDLSEISAEFSVVITGRATGLILFTRWDIEHPECLLACVHHLKCKSVNYNQKIKICELLDTNVNENIISPQEDWVAISTTDKEKVGEIIWLLDFDHSVVKKNQWTDSRLNQTVTAFTFLGGHGNYNLCINKMEVSITGLFKTHFECPLTEFQVSSPRKTFRNFPAKSQIMRVKKFTYKNHHRELKSGPSENTSSRLAAI